MGNRLTSDDSHVGRRGKERCTSGENRTLRLGDFFFEPEEIFKPLRSEPFQSNITKSETELLRLT
jgi:hypothetical protein